MKGSGLYLAKEASDDITSSFVATRPNLLPTNSLTHADERTTSVGSELVSS